MLIALLAVTGCTRNNGDIGEWFGMWQVERMEIDGATDEAYVDPVIMKFQGSVLETMTMFPNHATSSWFATWTDCGSSLTVDAAEDAAGATGLAPGLKLPWIDGLRIEVISQSGSSAHLRWTNPDNGQQIDYYLKKLI